MADDTLEIIHPPGFENYPSAVPKNTLPYEHGVLTAEEQKRINSVKVPTVREDQQYLAAHPEVNAIVTLLLRAAFLHRPDNIPEFLGDFMSRPEVENEIKDFLETELHTVVARGEDEGRVKITREYHFLEPLATKSSVIQSAAKGKVPDDGDGSLRKDNNAAASASQSIHLGEDTHKERKSKDTVESMSSYQCTEHIMELHTLLSAGKLDSTDSVGVCSLMGRMDMCKRESGDEETLDTLEGLDLPAGEHDEWLDEYMRNQPKRNLSGVSAISEQGVFKAVGVEEVVEVAPGSTGSKQASLTAANKASKSYAEAHRLVASRRIAEPIKEAEED